jgi:hypothetical protein
MNETANWLKERDDRTDRIVGVNENYKSAAVRIFISEDCRSSYSTQVMAIVAANILARWCNKISIVAKAEYRCLLTRHSSSSIQDIIKQVVIAANPFCELNITDESNDGKNNHFNLIIGNFPIGKIDNYVWINSNGWLAGYGFNTYYAIDSSEKRNVLGASFAACLGVSEIFRQAIGIKSDSFSKWFSLYDFNTDSSADNLTNPVLDSEIIDLGTIHQIGCGAIGSSFDFILGLTENIKTELHLIDFDTIENPNCSSSLTFTKEHVTNKISKPVACAEILKDTRINPYVHIDDYKTFIEKGDYKKYVPDMILCFANDKNIWSTIQYKLPPITYHATTNKSWGTNFGRHIPLKEWCIMCRFNEEIKHEFVPVCSEGVIAKKNQEEILGILPFLAPASAIIVLAELTKLSCKDSYPINNNFVEFSMKTSTGRFQQFQRKAQPCYVCSDQSIDLYPQNIKETKYWYLTEC